MIPAASSKWKKKLRVQLSREQLAIEMRQQAEAEQAEFGTHTIPGAQSTDSLTIDDLEQFAYSMREEINMKFSVQAELMSPWLSDSTVNMIHGSAGHGKTWVIIGTGLALATGKTFVPGWDPSGPPVKVLMVDGEMPPDQLRTRKWDIFSGHPDDIQHDLLDNLVTISNFHLAANGKHMLDLSADRDREILAAHIYRRGFKVVFLDNLSCLIPSINIKASEEYAPFNRWLLTLKAQGIAVIFVHHDNKSMDFTGANEMTFALQTRLHVKKHGRGWTISYPKFRAGITPKKENYALQPMPNGLAITTGVQHGTINQDICSYLAGNNGSADISDVRGYLIGLGHKVCSIDRKIRREGGRENGVYVRIGDDLCLA